MTRCRVCRFGASAKGSSEGGQARGGAPAATTPRPPPHSRTLPKACRLGKPRAARSQPARRPSGLSCRQPDSPTMPALTFVVALAALASCCTAATGGPDTTGPRGVATLGTEPPTAWERPATAVAPGATKIFPLGASGNNQGMRLAGRRLQAAPDDVVRAAPHTIDVTGLPCAGNQAYALQPAALNGKPAYVSDDGTFVMYYDNIEGSGRWYLDSEADNTVDGYYAYATSEASAPPEFGCKCTHAISNTAFHRLRTYMYMYMYMYPTRTRRPPRLRLACTAA